MFGVVVLLQNKFGANYMPTWWYCMDKYLTVFFRTKNTINPNQMSNSICRNAALNLQPTSMMLYCCVQTIIIVPLSSPLTNKLPSATAKYLKFWLMGQKSRACAAIFLHPISYVSVHNWVAWPCSQKAIPPTWKQLFHEDHFWPDLGGCTWVPLVYVSSELKALLNIFQFRRVISLMCLSSAALFPWPTTESTILNVARFFVLLQNSLNSTPWNPSLLWNLCLRETLLVQYSYLVSCGCAQYCHDMKRSFTTSPW